MGEVNKKAEGTIKSTAGCITVGAGEGCVIPDWSCQKQVKRLCDLFSGEM